MKATAKDLLFAVVAILMFLLFWGGLWKFFHAGSLVGGLVSVLCTVVLIHVWRETSGKIINFLLFATTLIAFMASLKASIAFDIHWSFLAILCLLVLILVNRITVGILDIDDDNAGVPIVVFSVLLCVSFAYSWAPNYIAFFVDQPLEVKKEQDGSIRVIGKPNFLFKPDFHQCLFNGKTLLVVGDHQVCTLDIDTLELKNRHYLGGEFSTNLADGLLSGKDFPLIDGRDSLWRIRPKTFASGIWREESDESIGQQTISENKVVVRNHTSRKFTVHQMNYGRVEERLFDFKFDDKELFMDFNDKNFLVFDSSPTNIEVRDSQSGMRVYEIDTDGLRKFGFLTGFIRARLSADGKALVFSNYTVPSNSQPAKLVNQVLRLEFETRETILLEIPIDFGIQCVSSQGTHVAGKGKKSIFVVDFDSKQRIETTDSYDGWNIKEFSSDGSMLLVYRPVSETGKTGEIRVLSTSTGQILFQKEMSFKFLEFGGEADSLIASVSLDGNSVELMNWKKTVSPQQVADNPATLKSVSYYAITKEQVISKSMDLATKLGGFELKKYLSLAEKGDEDVLMDLSRRYRRGLGVEKSDKNSYELLLPFARKGYPRAMHRVALHLINGHGVGQDKREAEAILRKIVDTPALSVMLEPAYTELIDLLLDDPLRKDEAFSLIEKGVQKGFGASLHQQAGVFMEQSGYFEGNLGDKMLLARAKRSYELAIETGFPANRDFLFYRAQGAFGRKEKVIALEELVAFAVKGQPEEMETYGRLLLNEGLEKDGIMWLEKATIAGQPSAEQYLAKYREEQRELARSQSSSPLTSPSYPSRQSSSAEKALSDKEDFYRQRQKENMRDITQPFRFGEKR